MQYTCFLAFSVVVFWELKKEAKKPISISLIMVFKDSIGTVWYA